MPLRVLSITLMLTLAACAASPQRSPDTADAKTTVAPHDQRDALAYVQTALEFEALCRQAYVAASRTVLAAANEHRRWQALNQELKRTEDPGQEVAAQPAARREFLKSARAALNATLDGSNALAADERVHDSVDEPLAVIVDIDETVLDNSPYQRRLQVANSAYDEASWKAWVGEASARAVPGAVDFAKAVSAQGVTVFYVTNRTAEALPATVSNLRAQGFPVADDNSNVLPRDDTRGWTKDKVSRRKLIDERYRVVALVGDNLGDFLGGVFGDNTQRAAAIAAYAGWWGERWIMLPNPTYGSWLDAVTRWCRAPATPADPAACVDSWLRDR